MAERIQLRRTKGWRLPDGAVSCARPSYWGNPWKIGAPDPDTGQPMTRENVLARFARYLETTCVGDDARDALAGKDLACWCPPEVACHVDLLLAAANRGTCTAS